MKECLQMAYDSRANHKPGTDMKILGPIVAEKYGLKYGETNDIQEAVAAVQRGGRVIVNVGGDRDGYIGVFTHGGHYITIVSADDKEVCILDPSWREDKWEEEGRVGKVRLNGHFAYCSYDVVDMDASNRDPRYYIFER